MLFCSSIVAFVGAGAVHTIRGGSHKYAQDGDADGGSIECHTLFHSGTGANHTMMGLSPEP